MIDFSNPGDIFHFDRAFGYDDPAHQQGYQQEYQADYGGGTAAARDFVTHANSLAAAVGKDIAEKAIAAGIKQVCFDRGGFRYHGRVKALADAAREAGLDF